MKRYKWGVVFGLSILVVVAGLLLYKWKFATPVSTRIREMKGYFFPFSIEQCDHRIPFLQVSLDGYAFLAQLDLGADEYLACDLDLLNQIQNKQLYRQSVFYGMQGKKYESPVYIVKDFEMGPLIFRELTAKQTNPEFQADSVLGTSGGEDHWEGSATNSSNRRLCQGSIGWRLFDEMSLLLDCKKKLVACCDGLETLAQKGYDVQGVISTELLLDRDLVEFYATTEQGPLRCMLDTGSTFNLFNRNLEKGQKSFLLNPDNIDQLALVNPQNEKQLMFDPEHTKEVSSFSIAGKDFDAVSFYSVNLIYEIDAVIGMEFLEEHIVLIDFPRKKIYFLKKEPSLIEEK